MTDDTLSTSDRIDAGAVEPVVRVGVLAAGVVALTALATALPGTGYELFDTGVVVGEVLTATATLALVVLLAYATPHVADLVASALDGPREVVDDAAAVAGYVVVFFAVVLAHQGLEPVLGALLGEGLHDLGFLLLAVVPLAGIAHRFWRSLDPITGLVTDELAADEDAEGPTRDGEGSSETA